jgi:hypothetical protein
MITGTKHGLTPRGKVRPGYNVIFGIPHNSVALDYGKM